MRVSYEISLAIIVWASSLFGSRPDPQGMSLILTPFMVLEISLVVAPTDIKAVIILWKSSDNFCGATISH